VDKGEKEKRTIKTHEDLIIYQKAFEAAMIIFELSKQFPKEERYSLTDHSLTCFSVTGLEIAEGRG
jgi:four helix bundle protein